MPINLYQTYKDRLSQSQKDTITYVSNVDDTGAVATTSFENYISGTPHVSVTGSGIGQAGTVYYSFDTTATSGYRFDAATQDNAAQALQIWSGLANITFVYTSNLATAPVGAVQLLFVHANDTSTAYGTSTTYGAGTSESTTSSVATGTTGVYQDTVAHIQIDTTGNYGQFGSTAYTDAFGYGVDTLVHEVGHLVGLGHTGPYNGTVTPATQQNNSTDVRDWSIMSYISPTDTTAHYYSTRSPTDVNYTASVSTTTTNPDGSTSTSTSTSSVAPFTPMGLDIFAAQRLSGAPTSTMFAGGQTFGFHSNITYTAIDGSQKSLSMYDFNIDTTPIVTLYDTGANNTLDLSGFTTTATVNLNDGTFSSAAGLTDNIFIEYGTQINTAVGSAGNDTFYVNANSDIITGGLGATNTVVFSDLSSNWTLSASGGTVIATEGTITDRLTNITTLQFSNTSLAAASITCFYAGTLIATPDGPRAVETLIPGDLVLKADGRAEKVRWLGRQTVSTLFADPLRVLPIRIAKGAIEDGIPCRDLLLSPDHAIAIDGILVQAAALVNHTTITREHDVPEIFIYYHIELEAHEVILAEGLTVESFVDNVERFDFDNWEEHEAAWGGLSEMVELDLPRAQSRRQVPMRLLARLDRRGEAKAA